MKVRLLTSLGIFVFGLPLLIFSKYIVYTVALGALSALAMWEVLRVFSLNRNLWIAIPAYLVAFGLPFFSYPAFFTAEEHNTYMLIMALVLFFYLLYLVFVSVFSKGRLGYRDAAAVFMLLTYVSVAFTSLGLLRYMNYGDYFFELVFVGAWVCDSFAYFTGRLLGKHKLCPELSPKKTVEGSLGGILFAVIAFLLYGLIIEGFFGLDANYLVLGLSALVVSVVSQLGDLFASLIKRERGVKDYSNILPGHGGIMDRFDSVIAVSAVLMVICMLFPPFTAAA